MAEGSKQTISLEQHDQDSWKVEKRGHLDGQCGTTHVSIRDVAVVTRRTCREARRACPILLRKPAPRFVRLELTSSR